MDGVVTSERWQRMDQIVEWCRFAYVISERRNLTFAYGREVRNIISLVIGMTVYC